MFGEVAVERGLEFDDRAEDPALEPAAGARREERLDRIEPRAGSRGEVEGPARVAGEPGQHPGVLVDGVIVEDRVDHLAGRDPSRSIALREAEELLVPMARHAAPDDPTIEER